MLARNGFEFRLRFSAFQHVRSTGCLLKVHAQLRLGIGSKFICVSRQEACEERDGVSCHFHKSLGESIRMPK